MYNQMVPNSGLNGICLSIILKQPATVLQCVAVCVLQCVVACQFSGSVLRVAMCVLPCVEVCCSVCVAKCCSVLQCVMIVATCCSMVQCVAVQPQLTRPTRCQIQHWPKSDLVIPFSLWYWSNSFFLFWGICSHLLCLCLNLIFGCLILVAEYKSCQKSPNLIQ